MSRAESQLEDMVKDHTVLKTILDLRPWIGLRPGQDRRLDFILALKRRLAAS